MSDRIHYSHLQRMLLDDTVPDDALKPYLKIDRAHSTPLGPRLVPDTETVDLPDKRGIVGLSVGLLNARAQRRRAANYARKIETGWQGLRLLAEGDSWFEYPILLKDVIDHLEDDYAIYCTSAAGDTLTNMVGGLPEIERLIRQVKPDAFLFSGGGNDIAGPELIDNLFDAQPGRNRPEDYLDGGFQSSLDRIRAQYTALFSRLTTQFPELKIFCHGYDWPFPMPEGNWLTPAMLKKKIPDELQIPILKAMIDRFYVLLTDLAGEYNGKVSIVDCRGVVGERENWFDELHPLDPGFGRAAAMFRTAIETSTGKKKPQTGQPVAVKLTWYPEASSNLSRKPISKLLPIGTAIDVGRHPDRGIDLDDSRVSRKHVRLDIGTDQITVEDLQSTNGTWIEGAQVAKQSWLPGQLMHVGNYVFEAEFILHDKQADTLAILNKSPVVARSTPGQPGAPAVVGNASKSAQVAPQALRPIEITVIHGNIANVSSQAYAMGVFDSVSVRGAASELDAVLQGNLAGLIQSRMFGTRLGEISLLPTPRQRMMMELIAFAGLGAIETFSHQVLHIVGQNLARVLVTAKVNNVTTIPMGVSAGCKISDFLRSFASGFLEGLNNNDQTREMLKLQICEVDKTRFEELSSELRRLAQSDFFASRGFAVSVREQQVGTQSVTAGSSRSREQPSSPIYLQVSSPAEDTLDYFVLHTDVAAVQSYVQKIEHAKQAELAASLARAAAIGADVGATLAKFYVPTKAQELIAQSLGRSKDSHLVIIHDRPSSGIPWEALYFGKTCPALEAGVSRIYRTATREKIHGRACLPRGATVRMLVIQNPTGDLKGAESEGQSLTELFSSNQGEVDVLSGKAATKASVIQALSSSTYDILHYAGHADFDEANPTNSGLICSDGRLLAADIAGLTSMPQLIFLNGCESGRLRGGPGPGAALSGQQFSALQSSVGLAEGFLTSGLMNFIGTYWPVDDLGATRFAQTFYKALLAGDSIGLAMRLARKEIGDAGLRDWANYLHFGDPMYRVRQYATS